MTDARRRDVDDDYRRLLARAVDDLDAAGVRVEVFVAWLSAAADADGVDVALVDELVADLRLAALRLP